MKEVEENDGIIDAEINGAEEERLSAGEIDDFGEKRAERARKEREPKKHMTMEKKMQKV